MSISFKNTDSPDGPDTTSHEGLVLRTGSREIRVMSDVWSTFYYAIVWNGRAEEEVGLGIAEFGKNGTAFVDATPEVVAAAEEWRAEREARAAAAAAEARAAQAEREARESLTEPRKGRTLRVVKGRKVPKGTEGVCIWRGEGRYGWRVGIKDASGEVHWTAESNCVALVEGKGADESWVSFQNRKWEEERAAVEAAEAAAPQLGDVVTLTEGNFEKGTVFWARSYASGGTKLGVARLGAKKRGRGYRDADVEWTWADKVAA